MTDSRNTETAGDSPQDLVAGRYELWRELGRGGMAVVYEGFDHVLERRVALKRPPEEALINVRVRKRFLAEARTMARLDHPHIVHVFDIVDEGGTGGLWIVMDLIDGTTASRWLDEHERFATPDAVSLGIQVAQALGYAHRAGVIHRDVKPANLFIDTHGWGWIGDFGIARNLENAVFRFTGRQGAGTLTYMAPEQHLGRDRDPRVDIYSLGATLYEMLTGQPPFETVDLLAAKEHGAFAPLRQIRGDVPEVVEDIVSRCLAPDPEARFPDARTLEEALRNSGLELEIPDEPSAQDSPASSGIPQPSSGGNGGKLPASATIAAPSIGSPGEASSEDPAAPAALPSSTPHAPHLDAATPPTPGLEPASPSSDVSRVPAAPGRRFAGWIALLAALGAVGLGAWLVYRARDGHRPAAQPSAPEVVKTASWDRDTGYKSEGSPGDKSEGSPGDKSEGAPADNSDGSRAGQRFPLPPHFFEIFLSPTYAPMPPGSGGANLAMILIVAKSPQRSSRVPALSAVFQKQQERLDVFAHELRQLGGQPVPDELRKEIHAWSQCICPTDARCQGGDCSCEGCAACEEMTSSMASFSPMRMESSRKEMPSSSISSLLAMACPPKNVCLTVDVSGSMEQGQKLTHVKEAIKESLRHYMKGDVFSLVVFSGEAKVIIKPTMLPDTLPGLMNAPTGEIETFVRTGERSSTPAGKVLIRFMDQINSLVGGGETNIRGALELAGETVKAIPAQRALLANPMAINRILLFSDGQNTFPVGGSRRAKPDELRSFQDLARKLTSGGRISLSTFGVGMGDFDENLMSALTDPSLGHSGSYHWIRHAKSTHRVLWNDLMVPLVARNVHVSIVLEFGVEAIWLGGSLYRPSDDSRQISGNLKNLSGDQKRVLVLGLRVMPEVISRRVGNLRLARVTLAYKDSDGVEKRQERIAEVETTANGGFRLPSNPAPIEAVLVQRTRDGFKNALMAIDQGQTNRAAAVLEAARGELEEIMRAFQRREGAQ